MAPRLQTWHDVDPSRLARLVGLDAHCFREDLRYPPEEYARRLALPGRRLRVALGGDDLVGFTLTYPDPHVPGERFLDVMAVHPDYRGSGLGRILLADAVQEAHALGHATLGLFCEPRDARGRDLVAFYAAGGFRVVERLDGYVRMRRGIP